MPKSTRCPVRNPGTTATSVLKKSAVRERSVGSKATTFVSWFLISEMTNLPLLSVTLPVMIDADAGFPVQFYKGHAPSSNVESEVEHVTILDDVFLAFCAHLAGLLRPGFASIGNEV